jgi:hypothetical protein
MFTHIFTSAAKASGQNATAAIGIGCQRKNTLKLALLPTAGLLSSGNRRHAYDESHNPTSMSSIYSSAMSCPREMPHSYGFVTNRKSELGRREKLRKARNAFEIVRQLTAVVRFAMGYPELMGEGCRFERGGRIESVAPIVGVTAKSAGVQVDDREMRRRIRDISTL